MTETDMIKRCKSGDRDAFNELVTKYQSPVMNMAYNMLSNYDDAADAAQEVFIRVYKGLKTFQGKSSLTTWIYKITTNVCTDALRKRRSMGETVSINAPPDSGGAPDIVSGAPEPDEQYERNERIKAVREAISELKEEHREVLTLCDIEQLSYEEAAEIIRCPEGTVKSRLNRARNALRKKLSNNKKFFY